ncbi:MAG TPA: hypothetical protein VM406_11300 [Noviherbaspirillum sp.]|nr:hypothetical protein [Noviherbaspirillum sp.]
MELNRRNQAVLARSFASEAEHQEIERQLASKAHSRDIDARVARARAATSAPRDVGLQDITMLSVSPILRSLHNWWLKRAERHYLICADVELQRMREAQMNIAYYQKRAAMARSARSV